MVLNLDGKQLWMYGIESVKGEVKDVHAWFQD